MMNQVFIPIVRFVSALYLAAKNPALAILIFLAGILSVSGQNLKWPHGKKAVIVLTYDDGLNSHLDIAIPQLDSFGLRGTFFLYGHLSENRFADWKKTSENGHETGNHSLFHPCRLEDSAGKSPTFSSENYDIPSMIREIRVMDRLLFAITGKHATSYAYPCSETVIGGFDYGESLKETGFFSCARIGGDKTIITDFSNLDYFKVPSYSVNAGTDASTLICYTEEVLKEKGLGIFVFHGIGGDYLSVDADVHLELLQFLKSHTNEIWVATFSEVMEYLQDSEQKL